MADMSKKTERVGNWSGTIRYNEHTAFGWQTHLSPEKAKRAGIVPWIGVLKVQSGNTEFATILTLIAEHLAAGIANDISKLNKETLRISTKAIFFKHNVPWYCDVNDYEIHPEFNNIYLSNTVAILHLDCDRQVWTPINWPVYSFMHQTKLNSRVRRNIYAIGLNDLHQDFEQIIFRMKIFDSSKCVDFYVREEINFEHLWPKHFFCSKAVDVKRQCVFDSGMALAFFDNGNWTLIGIGVLGPGCVLPSRYIDIFPYIPWMNEQKKKHMLSYRRKFLEDDKRSFSVGNKKDDNKKNTSEVTAIDPAKNIVSDTSVIEDMFYIKILNDSTMVVRPKTINLNIDGDCSDKEGVMMYRDADLLRTSRKPATGIFALSLYDLFYLEITCVRASVRCDRRSLIKIRWERGFLADSLGDLVKVVPHYKRGKDVPPKIWFITDSFHNYEHIRTVSLLFKFEFTGEAAINVDFYGTLPPKVRSKRPTIKPTTLRPRGTHPKHLSYTRIYQYEDYISTTTPTTTTILRIRRKMPRTKKWVVKKNRSSSSWN